MAFITTGRLKSVLSASGSSDYIELSRYDKQSDQYNSYKITVGDLLSSVLTSDWYNNGGNQGQQLIFDDATLTDYVDIVSQQTITGTKHFQYADAVQADAQRANVTTLDVGSLDVSKTAEFHNNLTCHGYMYGIAMSACWADLAEYYKADADYPPGTLVMFGGKEEVTEAVGRTANAVVTSKPGFILNSDMSSEYRVGLALAGRTPVRVIGPVAKFDRIQVSTVPGVGQAMPQWNKDRAVAVALEEAPGEDEKLVMCATLFRI